uniref:Candidate secreted effector n=1 Tax=Meloidogyne incognita TaxID=6306 RepID=A0A914LX23_MELIC
MKILKQKNIFSNKILLISLLLIAILFCQVCLGGNKKRNGKSINSEVNFQHKSERQSLSQSDSIKIDGKKKELEQSNGEQNLNKLNNEEGEEEVKKKEKFKGIEENTSNFGKEKIKNKGRKRGKGKKKSSKNQENSKQINEEKFEGITDEIFKNVEEEIWNDFNENYENI